MYMRTNMSIFKSLIQKTSYTTVWADVKVFEQNISIDDYILLYLYVSVVFKSINCCLNTTNNHIFS